MRQRRRARFGQVLDRIPPSVPVSDDVEDVTSAGGDRKAVSKRLLTGGWNRGSLKGYGLAGPGQKPQY